MHTKTHLLNRSAVRDKALATLAQKRPHLAAKFTRVSGEFFTAVEGALDGEKWEEAHKTGLACGEICGEVCGR